MEDNNKIFGKAEGLVETKVHGLRQNAYIVTEDKMGSFNNYSSDFQLWIAIGSVSVGGLISSFLSGGKNTWIFWICLGISTVSSVLVIKSYRRFKAIKRTMFVEMSETGPNLRILRASYGTKEKEFDIADKLNEKIEDDSLNIKIDNSLAGDPFKGVSKRAIVEYFIYGKKKRVIIKEGDVLKLP